MKYATTNGGLLIHTFIYIVIVLFFGFGVLNEGYLYELNYLVATTFLLAAWLIVSFTLKQLRLHLMHLFVVVLVLFYWASVFIAVDREQAILEAIKITALLPFSLLISNLTQEQVMKLFRWMPYMGAFLVVVGVVFQMERQNRLESTIGYANTLAIFLLISLLLTLFFYIQNARKGDLILMVIQACGLLLTFSRSVWVLWLVSLASLALFLELRKRDIWLKIVTVHLTSFIVTALMKRDILFFWSRVKSIQPETSEFRLRLVYWKDSILMIRDHFWLGAGGGGWGVLQNQYQSEAYFVRFVHNHYLQLALDIGVVGALLFIVGILFFYYRSSILLKTMEASGSDFSRLWMKGVMLISTVLLLHAGFDFDFSFLVIFAVFLVFIAFVMEQIPDSSLIRWDPTKMVKAMLLITLVGMLLCTSWVAVGKYIQTSGRNSVAAGDTGSAIQAYENVQKMLPWSASVHYDAAKMYVIRGNQTGNRNDYLLAKSQIEQAIHRVPDEVVYKQLNDELYQKLMKE
ncbi:O-antigen ligase family protein [Paenibacillus sp. LjRoot56]|uniref:O-antigen ligase family protein n=1 Tax=Paenibacillus sp. LjRoot56 TaxID=3342333 RepID=UPI003ECF4C96